MTFPDALHVGFRLCAALGAIVVVMLALIGGCRVYAWVRDRG